MVHFNMKLVAVLSLTTLFLLSPGVAQTSLPPPPPGKLISLGTHRLHLFCIGKGKPTVVLEAGAGDFSIDWSLVQQSVGKFTRVCAYDRAGYAWSDPGPLPRTLRQIAYELHLMLQKSKEKSPYVLVGQSMGGLIVRAFADQHPKDVAGMILLDCSHEDNQIMLNDKLVLLRDLSRKRDIPPVQLQKPKSQPVTTKQPTSTLPIQPPFDKLPATRQSQRLWALAQPSYAEARRSEFDFLPEELVLMHIRRSQQKYPLGDVPLIVLTRGLNASSAHQQLQKNLTELSSNSKHITIEKSGHHIQLDQPEAVVSAIREVVSAHRIRRP